MTYLGTIQTALAIRQFWYDEDQLNIIAMTAYVAKRDWEMCLDVGMDNTW